MGNEKSGLVTQAVIQPRIQRGNLVRDTGSAIFVRYYLWGRRRTKWGGTRRTKLISRSMQSCKTYG